MTTMMQTLGEQIAAIKLNNLAVNHVRDDNDGGVDQAFDKLIAALRVCRRALARCVSTTTAPSSPSRSTNSTTTTARNMRGALSQDNTRQQMHNRRCIQFLSSEEQQQYRDNQELCQQMNSGGCSILEEVQAQKRPTFIQLDVEQTRTAPRPPRLILIVILYNLGLLNHMDRKIPRCTKVYHTALSMILKLFPSKGMVQWTRRQHNLLQMLSASRQQEQEQQQEGGRSNREHQEDGVLSFVGSALARVILSLDQQHLQSFSVVPELAAAA